MRAEMKILFILAAWAMATAPQASCYHYDITFYKQEVDHFNSDDSRTFSQRVLTNQDSFGGRPGDPIFFYTGNEGDIIWFCNNTGLMWDIAPSYRALLVFAEHRYYGASLPFGADSYKDAEHLKYLAVEQALEDFAQIITDMKKTEKFSRSPVIAFGGSYGGMLSSWLRMKYPDVVIGALAGSAPIWYFTGLTPCNSAFQTITRDFEMANTNCSGNVRRSWSALTQAGDEAQGLQWLSHTFHLCQPLTKSADLVAWIQDTWFNLAMVDYPSPANFLEPLPAWPIKRTCQYLAMDIQDHKELLVALSRALSVYYNSSGRAECYNITQSASGNLGRASLGWDYQACTEMIMPMCSDGVTDMFTNQPWNLTAYEEGCMQKYGVRSQPEKIKQLFGGKNISAHSNIIFSNGLLDPWSGGGVLKSVSDSLVAVVIPNGAHHLDLRAATPQDPPEVKKARAMELHYLSKWIDEFKETQAS